MCSRLWQTKISREVRCVSREQANWLVWTAWTLTPGHVGGAVLEDSAETHAKPSRRASSPKADDVAHNHHAAFAPCIPRGHEEGCSHSSRRRRYAFCHHFTRFLSVLAAEGVGKSTIVTSLIKETYVAHVSHLRSLRSVTYFVPGPAYCSRGHNTARGHSRECYHIHCRYWR